MRDLHTYGNTPAAIYLAHYLQSTQNQKDARRVGKVLQEERETIKSVLNSHTTGAMNRKTFQKVVEVLARSAEERVKSNNWIDSHAGSLLANVVMGEYKILRNRIQNAQPKVKEIRRRASQTAARTGVYVDSTNLFVIDESSDNPTVVDRQGILIQRSRDYLNRKGKVNTLY
jgi:macrodomain Ter protein organizer (MatP/YcbG family)